MSNFKLTIAALFCLGVALPAFATPETTCFSVNSVGYYQVTQPISGAGNCIYVSGAAVSGTSYVEIDCGGNSVTSTGQAPLNIIYNAAPIYWHDCNFHGVAGYGNFVGYSGTGTGGWVYGYNNTYNGMDLDVESDQNYTSYLEKIYMGQLTIGQSNGANVQTLLVDNSAGGGNFTAGVYITDSNNWTVGYSHIIGGHGTTYYTSYGSLHGYNTDDGIAEGCGSSYASPCTGGTAYNNIVEDVYDDAIEFAGPQDGLNIHDNLAYRPVVAGIGCYGVWRCSIKNSSFANNGTYIVTTDPVPLGTQMFFMFGETGSTASFFTDNTFTGNWVDSPEVGSHFGYVGSSGTPPPNYFWATVSGNVFSGNYFGNATAGTTVVFQNSTGFSGGANPNYCGTTNPSPGPFTCY